MKPLRWSSFQPILDLLKETAPPTEQMALRLKLMERDVILPVKGVFVLIITYYLYFSSWFEDVTLPQTLAQQTIERFFIIYLGINIGVAAALIFGRRIAAATPMLMPR